MPDRWMRRFPQRDAGEFPIMVNRFLPGREPQRPIRSAASRHAKAKRPIDAQRRRRQTFAQILAKLDFFKFDESLQNILLDYEEKRSYAANVAFKSTC